jgi:hypothetical protein
MGDQPRGAKAGDPKSKDHVLDGGYFDNAGAETLREMTRAIRNLDGGGEKDLDTVFILIGYPNHDPRSRPCPRRASRGGSPTASPRSYPTTSLRRFSVSTAAWARTKRIWRGR